MTTLDDVLALQKTSNILYAPEIKPPVTESLIVESAAATGTLSVSLCNSTQSSTVYAYITGLAINNNSALFLLQSDGATPYYPSNPSSNGTALSANCAIALGAPGTTCTVTIPYIAGGRIWFCCDSTLTFLLNPGTSGPGLVEPSVSNTSDPNYLLSWDFCEFTYNSSQLYTNISYVDFVCLPISLTLTDTTGTVSHVSGMPSDGLATVCSNLIAQNNTDGAGWNQLVITNNGSNLRALSPTNGIIFNPSLFQNYWTNYINQVWSKYVSTPLTVDTQASWGTVTGYTSNDRTQLTFPCGSFPQPSAADIFGANSGAFAPQATNTAQLLNIGARLDAAFNRSTLLIDSVQPDNEVVSTYYTNSITNHYARIVHAANLDSRGYCFPYDDVTPNGGVDQSGFVNSGSPSNFLVTVGGGNAYAKRGDMQRVVEPNRMMKRGVSWDEDIKMPIAEEDVERDLEKGEHPKLLNELASPSEDFKLPASIERYLGPYLANLQSSPFYVNRLLPFMALIHQLIISVLSISFRTIVSRIFIVAFFIIFYFLGLLPHGSEEVTQRRMLETSLAAANGNGTKFLQSN
ncbi:glycoside hydrolase family 64 protein [Hyaloscypha hepaticicola]|uniref:Glycoside hydrolase family 64 protein n=1 Tax=Hyaloscypha hepaticicola TaxID=2082293 RepID=A0A2J6PSU2_9HELO|nr:glycoside hydrolase family 64 protein [Hyaloscypha hepaticicola]